MLEGTLQETPPSGLEPGGTGPAEPRDRPEGPRRGPASDPARFGLLAFLGTVTMLFVGFTSAYVVRRASLDWRPLQPPVLLWLNTAVLALSSMALQRSRRLLRDWDRRGAQMWFGLTGLLGVLFLAGQMGAWRLLRAQGVYLATNPHSSFFYLLTGIHALHLLGGLAWLAVSAWRLRAMSVAPGANGLGLFATYWHFLGLLWAYLLLLLFVF